jgi:N-acetylmuramoyl-L-alanine amidase
MKVMIDPGHGGIFSGRVAFTPKAAMRGEIEIEPQAFSMRQWDSRLYLYDGGCPSLLKEKNVNLYFGRLITEELKKLGAEVRMTRNWDTQLREKLSSDLAERSIRANAWDADCFISVHCNGFDDPRANGYEVFTTRGTTSADTLAVEIIHGMEVALHGMRLRADLSDGDLDKEADFAVLRRTKAPAVLIELGFLTNANDVITLLAPGTPRTVANHIAHATFNWWKEKLNR